MSNISIKINLRQLKSAVRTLKGKSGAVECLILPIADNQLFVGEKGIYLDMTAFELKEKKNGSKDTHLVKQSFSKEYYQQLTDEQKKELPILGNAVLWSGHAEPDANDVPIQPDGEDTFDDLPF